jgi:ferritin-like metal-binding protein YciE
MSTPKELFVHELQDVYYAEKQLTRVLPQLASEAKDRELSRAFESHLKETQKQVANLERVFKHLNRPAQGESCPGIDGIKREHDKFMQEHQTTEQLKDVFLTGAASRTEHYEIAAYTGLIEQARALGERESVKLLQANLKQEKEALRKVESIGKRLTKATSPNGTKRSTSRSSTRRSTTGRSSTRSTARRSTTTRGSTRSRASSSRRS